MKRRSAILGTALFVGALTLGLSVSAHAEEPEPSAAEDASEASAAEDPNEASAAEDTSDDGVELKRAGYVPGYRYQPALGLSPHVPRVPAPPGGVASSFGSPSPSRAWTFDFHGYVQAALAAGMGDRQFPPTEDQHELQLHSEPIVPGEHGSFEFTGTVPGVWAQLNFSYGNPIVRATVVIAGWRFSRPEGFFNPPGHIGINEAFLAFRAPRMDKLTLSWNVGAFSDRYGAMGQYADGKYGVSLMGAVSGVGETLSLSYDVDPEVTLSLEHGFKGRLDKAPVGIVKGSNAHGWPDPERASSWVHHAHTGVSLNDKYQFNLHYFYAWNQDDRAAVEGDPLRRDAKQTMLGADFRFLGGHLGHFYVGGQYTDVENARSFLGVVTVLNSFGIELSRFLGPATLNPQGSAIGDNAAVRAPATDNISGQMINIGFQYDLSLMKLLKYPQEFWGHGSDLTISLFGIHQQVASPIPDFDGDKRLKFGTDLTYNFLSWMGAGVRVDQVMPDMENSGRNFTIVAPRLIFHTDWASRDLVAIQYARWFYGDEARSATLSRERLDEQVLSIAGSMYF